MKTYDRIAIIKKFQEQELSLFTLSEFSRLFAISNQQTLYKKIQRLEKKGLIKKIIKGKYLFLLNKPSEFAIANFLRQPSYISLESALSFYGIITGFPYQMTSISVKKTKSYLFEKKTYQYTQISHDLFWGYEKKENFLIADKEKSLLDYLYLTFKGRKSLDLKAEFDLSEIDQKKLKNYLKIIKNRSFLKFIRRTKIC